MLDFSGKANTSIHGLGEDDTAIRTHRWMVGNYRQTNEFSQRARCKMIVERDPGVSHGCKCNNEKTLRVSYNLFWYLASTLNSALLLSWVYLPCLYQRSQHHTNLLYKAKRQYLLTCKVSRYCFLALRGTNVIDGILARLWAHSKDNLTLSMPGESRIMTWEHYQSCQDDVTYQAYHQYNHDCLL